MSVGGGRSTFIDFCHKFISSQKVLFIFHWANMVKRIGPKILNFFSSNCFFCPESSSSAIRWDAFEALTVNVKMTCITIWSIENFFNCCQFSVERANNVIKQNKNNNKKWESLSRPCRSCSTKLMENVANDAVLKRKASSWWKIQGFAMEKDENHLFHFLCFRSMTTKWWKWNGTNTYFLNAVQISNTEWQSENL